MPGPPKYDWATYARNNFPTYEHQGNRLPPIAAHPLQTDNPYFYPGQQSNIGVNGQQSQQQQNQQNDATIDPALLQQPPSLPAPLTPVTNLNRTRGYHPYIHTADCGSVANIRPYIATENHNSQYLWPNNKPLTKIHGLKGTPNDNYEVFHYDIGYAPQDVKTFVVSALYNDIVSSQDNPYLDKAIWDYLLGDNGAKIFDVVFGMKFFSNGYSIVVVRTWKGDVVAGITGGDSWEGAKDKMAIFVEDHRRIPIVHTLIKTRLADLHQRMVEFGTLALAH